MLKIIKYEFIKARASLLTMIIIAAGLTLLSFTGGALKIEWMKYVSPVLLFFFAAVAYVYTLVRGISAYSAELKNKTGYLLMMTPNGTQSMLFGKLIFSFLLAALMLLICGFAVGCAAAEAFGSRLAMRGYYNILHALAVEAGINPDVIIALLITALVGTLSDIVTFVAVGYLAVTISATLFQQKKGRGFMSFLFFIVLFALLMTAEYNLMNAAMRADAFAADTDAQAILARVIPIIAFNFIAVCGLICASAALLKKRVCL